MSDSYETRHHQTLEALSRLQGSVEGLPAATRRKLAPALARLQSILLALEEPATRQDREALYRFHEEQLDITRQGTLSEMIRVLGHELNQPLAAIISYAQSCLQMADQGLEVPGDVREALEEIALQGRRAARLIQRVRELSRLKPLPRERVAFRELLDQVMAFNHREIRRRGLTLELELADALPPLWVNGGQIRHALLNLFNYCLRAEATGLTLSARSRGQWLIVHLRAAPLRADPEALFDPFLGNRPDTGLIGLTVARSIIEAHGGNLEVASGQDGLCFMMGLPFTPTPGGVALGH